jgi:hypothetical protein
MVTQGTQLRNVLMFLEHVSIFTRSASATPAAEHASKDIISGSGGHCSHDLLW